MGNSRDCEVWTITLEIQDNDRTVASLWLSQYSNLLVCLFSPSVSVSISLASLSHIVYGTSAEMEYGPQKWNMATWRFFLRTKVSDFLMPRFSGSPHTLQRLCSTCQGICHLILQQDMAVALAAGLLPSIPSRGYSLSLCLTQSFHTSDFGTAKPVSWKFLLTKHIFSFHSDLQDPLWLCPEQRMGHRRDCTESAVL